MRLDVFKRVRYTFSGHESFQCRHLWLKKGFDYIRSGMAFSADDAVCELGVGKNMVTSIKYWLKAFNIIDQNDTLTEFAESLLSEDGYDRYLEDEGSLWLLHYYLVRTNFASTYSLIFNEFRRERIQFTRENYISFLRRKADVHREIKFNEKTVRDDFDVFRKMYIHSQDPNSTIEDSFSGLLSDLNLVKSIGKGKDEGYFIENSERKGLPLEILLYSVVEQERFTSSISLSVLEYDPDGPGSIFALNRTGLRNMLKEAAEKFDFLTYKENAGVMEMQFKEKIQANDLLQLYYEK